MNAEVVIFFSFELPLRIRIITTFYRLKSPMDLQLVARSFELFGFRLSFVSPRLMSAVAFFLKHACSELWFFPFLSIRWFPLFSNFYFFLRSPSLPYDSDFIECRQLTFLLQSFLGFGQLGVSFTFGISEVNPLIQLFGCCLTSSFWLDPRVSP
jgi:hypothetical protein